MPTPREPFLIEIIRQGSYAKATAVDPVSGREASIVGPSVAPDGVLSQQAVQKLRRLLAQLAPPIK